MSNPRPANLTAQLLATCERRIAAPSWDTDVAALLEQRAALHARARREHAVTVATDGPAPLFASLDLAARIAVRSTSLARRALVQRGVLSALEEVTASDGEILAALAAGVMPASRAGVAS